MHYKYSSIVRTVERSLCTSAGALHVAPSIRIRSAVATRVYSIAIHNLSLADISGKLIDDPCFCVSPLFCFIYLKRTGAEYFLHWANSRGQTAAKAQQLPH